MLIWQFSIHGKIWNSIFIFSIFRTTSNYEAVEDDVTEYSVDDIVKIDNDISEVFVVELNVIDKTDKNKKTGNVTPFQKTKRTFKKKK